jgi:general secretion pathway protein E
MALRATALLPRSTEPVSEVAAPAVRAVEATFRRAVVLHASDVHIEPTGDGGRIRLRVDGLLRTVDTLDAVVYPAFVSRIKLLASLDVANRRIPQDGRYALVIDGRTVDARVASIPTVDGEKLAIRLLDCSDAPPRLDALGMQPATLTAYRRFAGAPSGFVVVAGPTGSGKTTTLYASLAELDRATRNVCTVEDPVETRLPFVTHVHVNPRAGLTFPAVLRAVVRQDPDVIMIGEIRDAETCAVGVAAALAGQTVFATVHSNDAARTIDRLVELGIARHSLAAALTAVVAQRLVRTLCGSCGGTGCSACGGMRYRGRTGVFELLAVDDAIRDAIASGASSATIARIAAAAGARTLAADAAAKLAAGLTDRAEVLRVVGEPLGGGPA